MNLVLKHIKFLAEDTNLVALNSSIGADRAGASGKGFDVVANETKVLSNRSKIAQISLCLNVPTTYLCDVLSLRNSTFKTFVLAILRSFTRTCLFPWVLTARDFSVTEFFVYFHIKYNGSLTEPVQTPMSQALT